MFLESEILKIRKVQRELNIELNVQAVGLNFILNEISSINIPGPIRCSSVDELIRVVKKLDNQASVQEEDSNVVYLYSKNEEERSFGNDCEIIQFPKKEKTAYSEQGYQLAESDPKDMERALLFINNMYKTRDKYPAELEKIFEDNKERT